MHSSPKTPTKRKPPAASDVAAFLAGLEHPFKDELLSLRKIILGADASIREGIKWNAPSFCTSEYFATFHLRAKGGVQLILHLGAKKRAKPTGVEAIPDPKSLLEWLGTDRATVKFRDAKDIAAKRLAFAKLIREWIQHV